MSQANPGEKGKPIWDSLFLLDPTSPSGLRWKIKPANQINIGDVAGNIASTGYWVVCYKYTQYKIHRIIWECNYGSIPSGKHIDHVDGNTLNNDIHNLRLASRSENNWNQQLSPLSTTGTKGLTIALRKGRKYWRCEIKKYGKKVSKFFLFTELNKLKAIRWLQETRSTLHGEYTNHGEHHGL